MKHERGLALIAFATVCVVWGTTYLAIRIAVETIPPFLMTASRFLVAGTLMLGIALWRGEKIPRDRATLANLALMGFLMLAVCNLAVVWAEQWVPSGLASLFVATGPFWMAIVEGFRAGGERPDVRSGLGMLIGFVGVALLVTPGGAGASWTLGLVAGALAIQAGEIAWQLGTVRGKYHLKNIPLFVSSSLQMLFGGTITGIIGLAIGEASRFSLTPRTFGALAYLIIFGSIVAYSAYVYATKHIRTTKLSLFAYINPVVAVVLGWWILDEELTWVSILAMVIILGGLALVQTSRSRAPKLAVVPAAEEKKNAA
jgi:drug/metabolite transporter (DMT)-like permease